MRRISEKREEEEHQKMIHEQDNRDRQSKSEKEKNKEKDMEPITQNEVQNDREGNKNANSAWVKHGEGGEK